MADISARKRIWGWWFFDWASQPYHTLLVTFIFGPYFAAVAAEHGCEALDDPRRLAGRVQAVSVAVPTVAHAEVGVALIESGADVLIENFAFGTMQIGRASCRERV